MTLVPTDLDAALADFAARRPLLVASDYDGVLAPLRDHPDDAVPGPGVAEALARLAAVDGVTVALVSGRGVADLRTTSGLSGPYRWVGSHGAEFDGPLRGELADRRDRLADRLAPVVATTEGAWLEVKPVSVAVHVRKVQDRLAAAARRFVQRRATIVQPAQTCVLAALWKGRFAWDDATTRQPQR